MPDDLNNQSGADNNNGGAEGGQSGADNNNSDNQDAGGGEAGAGDNGGQGGQGADDGAKPGKGPKKDAKAPADNADDGEEPVVRPGRSSKDFIIQRQQRKMAKGKPAPAQAADDEDNDDEIAPEDEALISKVFDKKVAPIMEQTLKAADEQDIRDFLAENPDFKPYEAKARRFIAHPSRRHLPVKSVFYEVAGPDLLKLGAARSKAADDKARQSQTGGGSNRQEGAGKGEDVWKISKEDFAKKQEKIRRGQQ